MHGLYNARFYDDDDDVLFFLPRAEKKKQYTDRTQCGPRYDVVRSTPENLHLL